MVYEQDYFTTRNYLHKQQIVECHVREVLRWATKTLHSNLLDGAGKRALDVGCAYGYTSKVLAELGYETVGVDISVHAIKQAKTHFPAEFLVHDAQNTLPFKAACFDLVTCFDVLEHLSNPEQALRSMFEVCRGTLVCTTPNKKVEKPVRKIMHDYDETHISTKTPLYWQQVISSGLYAKALRVATFYDLTFWLGGKLFFKSFNVPNYGLTVRMAIKKY